MPSWSLWAIRSTLGSFFLVSLAVAHALQEVTDEILQRKTLEFTGETFEYEVAGVFFDVLGNGRNGFIFAHGGSYCLTFEGCSKFAGVVFDLK